VTDGTGLLATQLDPPHLLAELIRIPSTYEHEHAMLEFVETYLSQLGLAYSRVAYDADKLSSLAGACAPFSRVEGRRCVVARYPGPIQVV